MSGPAGFLGARPEGEGACTFEMGRALHGAFGGVFGGAVAAACVLTARTAAPGRRPFSLHATFLRGLSTPTARAVAEVVNEGRTATTVSVDLHDAEGKRAARATVTLAEASALKDLDAPGPGERPDLLPFEEGRPLPPPEGIEAPIMDLLGVRLVGKPGGGYAHAVPVPWEAEPDDTAEAACVAADFCVGVPVGAALAAARVRAPIPNPDLSLRFAGHERGDVVVGIGRLGRIDRGVAATAVEVWSEGALLALGLSSAVVLDAAL